MILTTVPRSSKRPLIEGEYFNEDDHHTADLDERISKILATSPWKDLSGMPFLPETDAELFLADAIAIDFVRRPGCRR